MALSNIDHISEFQILLYGMVRVDYRLRLKALKLSQYALVKRLRSKGHTMTEASISKFLNGTWWPKPIILILLYSEIGIIWPDQVLTTTFPGAHSPDVPLNLSDSEQISAA